MEATGEREETRAEKVPCPFCAAPIDVFFTPPFFSWSVSRISAGAKRTKKYHEPRYRVPSGCAKCGKPAGEIKEALERGQTRKRSHEERLARLKAAGFTAPLEEPVRKEGNA